MTRVRLNDDGGLASPGLNADGDYGSLRIGGGTDFDTASDPTNEVIDGTGVAAGLAFGCAVDATAGTITISRPGVYRLDLNLSEVSSASASGVITVSLQKNGAAFSPPITGKLLQPAVAANFMDLNIRRIVSLTKNDTVRAVVTGTTGGVIKVEHGELSVEQLSDLELATHGD